METGEDCRGDTTGAAGQGFILHAALIGPDLNLVAIDDFDKVGVGAGGLKQRVVPDCLSQRFYRNIELIDKDDRMGNAGVEVKDLDGVVVKIDRTCRTIIVGIGHPQTDGVVLYFGGNDAGQSAKANLSAGNTMKMSETGGATPTVAAHFCDRAIGVVKTPGKVGIAAGFNEDKAIGPYPDHSPTDPSGEFGLVRQSNDRAAMIDNDEIVAGAAHFGKTNWKINVHKSLLQV